MPAALVPAVPWPVRGGWRASAVGATSVLGGTLTGALVGAASGELWTRAALEGIAVLLLGLALGVTVLGLPRRWLIPVVAFMLTAPIFVRIGGGSLIGLPETSSTRVGGQTLPLGVLICLGVGVRLFVVALLGRHLGRMGLLYRSALAFVAVATLVLLVGGLLSRFSVAGILYFLQTLAPLTAFFVALYLLRGADDTGRALTAAWAGVVASATVLLGQALVTRDVSNLFQEALDARLGPLNVYQANDYVPFQFAVMFLVMFTLAIERRRMSIVPAGLLIIVGITIGALYPRGAILVLGLGAIVAIAPWRRLTRTKRHATLFLVGLVTLGIALGLPSVRRLTAHLDAILQPWTIARAVTSELSARDRLLSMWITAEYVGNHPLLGAGFVPPPAQELSPRIQALPADRLFPAHNQYLDVALRGGLTLLAGFVALMVIALWRTSVLARNGATPFARAFGRAVFVALLASVLVGNMYQQNFTQPFTGFLLWFLIGAVETLHGARHEAAAPDGGRG